MAKTAANKATSGNANQRLDNLERRLRSQEKLVQQLTEDLESLKNSKSTATNTVQTATSKSTTYSSSSVLQIPVQLVSKNILLPVYAHSTDAGFDFVADKDYYISPGCTVMIRTGLKMSIPEGYELQVRPRSGISLKTDLRVANSPGTVDSGYLDEICVLLTNTYRFKNINARVVDIKGNKIDKPPKGYPKLTVFVRTGDRIAQGVISKIYKAEFISVSDINSYSTFDRKGGFGSTGV